MYWILIFRESKRIDDIELSRINNRYPSKVIDQQNMVKIMGVIYNGEADHVNTHTHTHKQKRGKHLLGRDFVGIGVVKPRTI